MHQHEPATHKKEQTILDKNNHRYSKRFNKSNIEALNKDLDFSEFKQKAE